jgi:DNA-binding XRE family transcriptional regulator
MKKSWDRSAMRFSAAAYLGRQRMLDVTFQNGDRFVVAIESVLSKHRNGTPIQWSKLRIGETGDTLEVPARDTVVEIPWDRIRSLADPDFRAHLADRSAERARHLGARMRKLRLDACLTRAQLAATLGIPQKSLASFESGKIAPPSDLLQNLALALGKQLCDLAE